MAGSYVEVNKARHNAGKTYIEKEQKALQEKAMAAAAEVQAKTEKAEPMDDDKEDE